MHRRRLAAAILGLCGLLGGCSAPPARVLTVPGDQYETAFASVLSVLRENGYPAELGDPRAGVIETAAKPAPTLLEPWHVDGASFDDRIRNTLSAHRRRVRVEFRPVGAITELPGGETLAGADLLDLDPPPPAVGASEGPIEVRVWVWLEQANTTGIRRDPWSRRLTTRTEDPLAPREPRLRGRVERGVDELRTASWVTWQSVARDPDVEAVLLGRIAAGIERSTSGPEREAAGPGDTAPGGDG